jgi:Na+-transporting methylmalonyl-CoA/oxaloacetate decarboxylase gamma subunit
MSTGWTVGLVLGVLVILIAAMIVITIVRLAQRIAKQARTAVEGVGVVKGQTVELNDIGRINDSGVRILHSARALRKVAVGK